MTAEEFNIQIIPYSRKLYPLIKSILKDEEESRDAIQDLMLKLWSKRNELEKCSNQQAYIITMAKNYCFDVLKKKKPERISQENENKVLSLQSNEKRSEAQERLEHVHKIIEKLPGKYKEVIKLRDINGFSFDEIKAMTDFEVPYIRVILSRARQRVKSELLKIYDYERGTEQPVRQVL